MATYRAIASTETDPQAPVTSALMKALEANPTAIAEGAINAPKVMGVALDTMLANADTSALNPVGWTSGLDRATWVEIDYVAVHSGTGTPSVQARLSSDGGSSWSAYSSIAPSFSTNGTQTGRAYVNIKTGEVRCIAGNAMSTTTLAFTGSPNALQLRISVGAGSDLKMNAKIIGGVSP